MTQNPKLGFSEILGETRLFGEYLRFRGDSIVHRQHVDNPANWRPVLLIPGFLAGDASLYPLGARLASLGHKVFYGGIWVNADCPRKTIERLRKRLLEVHAETGRKVVVIGHSLGGVYARELARHDPDLVERVFLLGSPVKHALGNSTPLLRPFMAAMRMMHSHCIDSVTDCEACGVDLPEDAPDVPETCVYTKSDGIVEWHSCIDTGPQVECIEVASSHCGIPLSLETWRVISDRLATPLAEPRRASHTRTAVRARAVAPRTPHRTRPSYLKLVSTHSGDAA